MGLLFGLIALDFTDAKTGATVAVVSSRPISQ